MKLIGAGQAITQLGNTEGQGVKQLLARGKQFQNKTGKKTLSPAKEGQIMTTID